MISIRHAKERGHADHGWLNSYHTFSFADYYDPNHMGYSVLRVINDDTVAAGAGFSTHGHRDMEIISYVLDGALAHKDSMGNGSVIKPGDVQRMSAGTGVTHSEFNGSDKDAVHFLQIWILPDHQGHQPGYAQKHFPIKERHGRWRLLVSPDGRDDSLPLNQNALLYGALLQANDEIHYSPTPNRKVYLHIARGSVLFANELLEAGDGVAVDAEATIQLRGKTTAEVLLFDLP